MEHRDLPIKTSDEDKLNFSEFASKIAKGILNYKQEETLIFSIEGEWGSGKTSLINLIKNELLLQNELTTTKQKVLDFIGSDQESIKFMHFNPWLMTDIEQVIKLFFAELKYLLENKNSIIKKLDSFEDKLLVDNIKFKVPFAEVDYKIDNSKDINSIKSEINEYLKKTNKKYIIIIDDIDRLTDEETEFIFRLTKGIADFNNLIYILLYDKAVVTKSLERFKSERGQKYLEKIIQYSLNVPKPHISTIKRLLFKQLDEILTKLEEDNCSYIFQKERWNYVHRLINKYIKTVRDISQIINIMSFEYPIICEDVNFTDFFLISLIKIKNHNLYDAIKNQPNDFFIDPNNIFLETKKEAEKLTKNFNDNMKEFHIYRDILEIMFPVLKEKTYSDVTHHYNNHKEKFISDIYYHEHYFAFAISDDKLSMQEYYELEEVILSSDFELFKTKLLEVDKKNKTPIFLDMFVQLKLKNLKEDNDIENAFINLSKISQTLESKDNMGFFTNSPINWRCERIAFEIIIKHNNLSVFIKNFIQNNTEVRLQNKINLFEYIKEDLDKSYRDFDFTLDDDVLELVMKKLRSDLESITLKNILENKDLSYFILRFELVNASLDNLSTEIEEYIFKSQSNFFDILRIFVRTSTVSSSHKGTYEKHSISKDSLSKLVSLDDIQSYIKTIDNSQLDNDQRNLLNYWEKGDRWY